MKLVFVPYSEIGNAKFKADRAEVLNIFGEPVSQSKYGYPQKDNYLDSYGFFNVLCDEKLEFEAIELFPDMTNEEICLVCGDVNISLSADVTKTLNEIKKITDDMILDNDGDGYSSEKLGLRIYCSDDIVEEVIIHSFDYCH